jgi:uncharacterized membrane-anchored protein
MAPTTPDPRGVIPHEWPAQAADAIVDTIAKVRDRTTKPVIIAARAAVYGLLAAVGAGLAFFLLLVLIVRIWANYVPGHVWVIYAIFAAVFSLAGWLMIRKAHLPSPEPELDV